jgi:hypothetical protein
MSINKLYTSKLVHPSNVLVSGPTGCGKTWFVYKLLEHNMFTTRFDKIVVVYSEWQPTYDKLQVFRPDVKFVKEFNDELYEEFDSENDNLLILDDQMTNVGNNKTMTNLFTKGSHHRNITIVYLVQNFYEKNKNQRTLTLNAQYIILFKNPRGNLQAAKFGAEMYPHHARGFAALYAEATTNEHTYILIDNRPSTPECMRIRSHILPGEEQYVYVPQGV